jgi:hypothetical protein
MLNLPRFLAKGLIYSFLFSSPSCQDLNFLPTPSLLPASLGSSPSLPASPSPLAAPSTLAQDYALPLSLGKTRWSHASLLHLPGLYELTVRPPPEPHIPYLLKAYYKFLLLIL